MILYTFVELILRIQLTNFYAYPFIFFESSNPTGPDNQGSTVLCKKPKLVSLEHTSFNFFIIKRI